jgi:hypothetical protein
LLTGHQRWNEEVHGAGSRRRSASVKGRS